MSEIDFNPKVPAGDAESAAEHARDDDKKVAQKAAAFTQAMQRLGTAPGQLPPTAGAAQQAQKLANLAATAGTTANVPTAAVLQQAAGLAVKQATPGTAQSSQAGAGSPMMKAMSGGAEGTDATARSAGGGASGDAAISAGGSPGSEYSPIQQQRHAGSESGGRDGASQDQSNSSSSQLKSDLARDKASSKDAATSHADKPATRIDLASIVPSFPVPTQSLHTPTAAQPGAARPVFNADLIQQIVEYAMVTHNAQGQAELHMGLTGAALGGVGVHLTACGRRRVRIRFTGVTDSDAIGESEVTALIESLRGRNVEVADVIME